MQPLPEGGLWMARREYEASPFLRNFSGNPKVGAGAIFELSRVLNAFYEDVKGENTLL